MSELGGKVLKLCNVDLKAKAHVTMCVCDCVVSELFYLLGVGPEVLKSSEQRAESRAAYRCVALKHRLYTGLLVVEESWNIWNVKHWDIKHG